MYKFRAYIAFLFLALLLFSQVEKLRHELGHLHEANCDTEGLHYCALEHSCKLCDYIFSSAPEPPKQYFKFLITLKYIEQYKSLFVSNTTTSPKYTFSLRGPPFADHCTSLLR